MIIKNLSVMTIKWQKSGNPEIRQDFIGGGCAISACRVRGYGNSGRLSQQTLAFAQDPVSYLLYPIFYLLSP